MALYFVTLSLLILAVLGVRAVFRKTVSPRLIYALWIAVVLRLCLPVSLFDFGLAVAFGVDGVHHTGQLEILCSEPICKSADDY